MTVKKIAGYVFYVLAILLILAMIAQLDVIIISAVKLTRIFSSGEDDYEKGRAVGSLFYWVIHVARIITLWKYARRWISGNVSTGGKE